MFLKMTSAMAHTRVMGLLGKRLYCFTKPLAQTGSPCMSVCMMSTFKGLEGHRIGDKSNQTTGKSLSPVRIVTRSHTDHSCTDHTEGEHKLAQKLKEQFPKASTIDVRDISGGCGSMYEVYVVAEEFRGKKMVMQHRMVNEALKSEIKDMHGLRISTEVPS